jgi:hypothetical protein
VVGDMIFARFSETSRYDPLKDCEVVRFMATTEKGSYHCEVPTEGAGTVRAAKSRFKELVVECIRAGLPPKELQL